MVLASSGKHRAIAKPWVPYSPLPVSMIPDHFAKDWMPYLNWNYKIMKCSFKHSNVWLLSQCLRTWLAWPCEDEKHSLWLQLWSNLSECRIFEKKMITFKCKLGNGSPSLNHQIPLFGYPSPLKSCIKEIKQNLILHSHFLELPLFQITYLEIILCPVSRFYIYLGASQGYKIWWWWVNLWWCTVGDADETRPNQSGQTILAEFLLQSRSFLEHAFLLKKTSMLYNQLLIIPL